MMNRRVDLRELAGPREGVTLLLLLVALGVGAALSPNFVSGLNLSFAVTNVVEIGLIAIPMTLLMVMGEIDLSVGSIIALTAAVLGVAVTAGVPFLLAVALALLVGTLAGITNGLVCVGIRLPSLVLTLGTLALYQGVSELLIGARTVTAFPEWFMGWNNRYVVGLFTYPQLFLVLCMVGGVLLVHRSVFGRHAYFIGANVIAAKYAGIHVGRSKVIAFGLSGLISAVAALVLVSRLQSLDNSAGSGFELIVITAVLLGGTDFRGGRGTVLGTALAVLLVGVVENGLELGHVSAQTTTAVVGALLILSFGLDYALHRLAPRLARRGARSDVVGMVSGGSGNTTDR